MLLFWSITHQVSNVYIYIFKGSLDKKLPSYEVLKMRENGGVEKRTVENKGVGNSRVENRGVEKNREENRGVGIVE